MQKGSFVGTKNSEAMLRMGRNQWIGKWVNGRIRYRFLDLKIVIVVEDFGTVFIIQK